jgi:CBS domain-containing protein
MNRNSPVRDVMTADVVTVDPDSSVEDAIRLLVDRGVDAAPVVESDGTLVGMLSDSDLIVQETELHFPTLISFLGASIEIGHKRFEEELTKSLGATVREVMTAEPITCADDDSVESAATLMHDNDVSRLPVTLDGKLVGIVARRDILRAILASD